MADDVEPSIANKQARGAPLRDEALAASTLHAVVEAIRRDPAKLAAAASFWLVAVGFAELFGTGIAFGINIIDVASPSDFLIAGLRNPTVIVLAAVTGWVLYRTAHRAQRQKAAQLWLVLGAILLLWTFTAVTAGVYRRSIVKGDLLRYTWLSPPEPLEVTLAEDNGTEPVTLQGYRIALVTSEFFVFGAPGQDTLVVARSNIRRMRIPDAGLPR